MREDIWPERRDRRKASEYRKGVTGYGRHLTPSIRTGAESIRDCPDLVIVNKDKSAKRRHASLAVEP